MKIIIFSDVHGNLEALQAALDTIGKYVNAQVYSLGDIVGYGANPKECITEVKRIAHVSLAGNHDHAAVGLTDVSYFNPYAKDAVLWTSTRLSDDDREYLWNLPFFKTFPDRLCLVHSTPKYPEQWNYILHTGGAEKNFLDFDGPLCFIGHSHVPMVFESGPEGINCKKASDEPFQLKVGNRYIINVGSIGQPRDGDWRACLLIYDEQNRTAEFKRLEYDLSAAQEKIRKAGLPDILAQRLKYGR